MVKKRRGLKNERSEVLDSYSSRRNEDLYETIFVCLLLSLSFLNARVALIQRPTITLIPKHFKFNDIQDGSSFLFFFVCVCVMEIYGSSLDEREI